MLSIRYKVGSYSTIANFPHLGGRAEMCFYGKNVSRETIGDVKGEFFKQV
jgi:hypothetical protein